MNKNLLWLSIILIVILAGILGYYLYSNSSSGQKTPARETVVPTQGSTPKFTTEEDILTFINNQPQGAIPQGVHRDFYNALFKLGQDTNTVTVSNCKATPVIAKLKIGQDLIMKNNDQTDYTIRLFDKNSTLSGSQTSNFKIPPKNTFYSYRCAPVNATESGSIVGIVYVIP